MDNRDKTYKGSDSFLIFRHTLELLVEDTTLAFHKRVTGITAANNIIDLD